MRRLASPARPASCRLSLMLLLLVAGAVAAAPDEDHRAWQHGVDVLRVGERFLVVWGSPGNPPQANPGGDWQHDVFYAWLQDAAGASPILGEPQVLVAGAEAQEPPALAINAAGTLLLTSEDGSDGINQLAGMWDSNLRVLRKYPFTIRRGGHSGHVAAMGERFLVTYGEGWAEGGGFLGRGTGRDIHARIIENDGTRRRETKIAAGRRDGWPLVAGSERNWLVVWQRYPEMSLFSALVDAEGRASAPRRISGGMPVRYAYAVEYVPQLASYVVAGTSAGEGFVALLNRHGEIESVHRGLPPMVSESRLLVHCDGRRCLGAYPVRPHGVAIVSLSADGVELVERIEHPYAWDYIGTSGVFVSPTRLLFVTLSTTGIKLIPIERR
jgi:hypothetical protein